MISRFPGRPDASFSFFFYRGEHCLPCVWRETGFEDRLLFQLLTTDVIRVVQRPPFGRGVLRFSQILAVLEGRYYVCSPFSANALYLQDSGLFCHFYSSNGTVSREEK